MKRGETVILAAGDFPRKDGDAWRLLANARRVVACDSAANAYHRRFRKWPTVVIGDLDSISLPTFNPQPSTLNPQPLTLNPQLIRIADQDTNDLEKAIAYCAKRGWCDPVIVGATGKREDHTLGNVFRALEHRLEIVTDCGRFLPVCGRRVLRLPKGTAVSVFAPDSKTRMTSKGLEWPLDAVKFRNLYCATLNRTSATTVILTSTHPAYVFVSRSASGAF